PQIVHNFCTPESKTRRHLKPRKWFLSIDFGGECLALGADLKFNEPSGAVLAVTLAQGLRDRTLAVPVSPKMKWPSGAESIRMSAHGAYAHK
ncbi:MAG: hypothetical protein ACK56I_00455, partial [bacterium]